ncbi:MAG: Gfo/Idh/MocA family oxidoreductase [bacterium]|nr:Gfo/Idh/MocA family oxidoreductase [bacterium]
MSLSNARTKVKIGLIGTGHLGTFHGNLLSTNPEIEFVGVYDIQKEVAIEKANKWSVKVFDTIQDLIDQSDAVDIVSPTTTHSEIAIKALEAGKHVFVEKPLAHTVEDGQAMVQCAKKNHRILQVGHVERFNRAVRSLEGFELVPKFIESHRLAPYKPRGVDVSVVFDLMIHDLDVILHLIEDPIVNVVASGVAVVSPSADIVNARLTFAGGQTANVTASRLSLHPMRKMRMFQSSSYVALDFQSGQAEIIFLQEDHPNWQGNPLMSITLIDKTVKTIARIQPEAEEANAIGLELSAFVKAIQGEIPVVVSGEQGLKALEIAHRIEQNAQPKGVYPFIG